MRVKGQATGYSASISSESTNMKIPETDRQINRGPDRGQRSGMRHTFVQTNMYAARAGAESRALKQNVMFHYGNGALWRALLNNNFQMSG